MDIPMMQAVLSMVWFGTNYGALNNFDQDVHFEYWEHSYDALLAFECDGNHYINGMKSHHSNHYEDRIWGFNCCEMHEIHLYDCKMTDWTNMWDGHQDYSVPTSYVLKGVISIHDNGREDRLYRYEICRVARNDGGSLIGRRRVEGLPL